MSRLIPTTAGALRVAVVGNRDAPDDRGIEVARRLLENPTDYVAQALALVRADVEVQEFAEGNGEIVVDGFTVHPDGTIAVDLSLTKWPDATMSVRFRDGKPYDIELGA